MHSTSLCVYSRVGSDNLRAFLGLTLQAPVLDRACMQSKQTWNMFGHPLHELELGLLGHVLSLAGPGSSGAIPAQLHCWRLHRGQVKDKVSR